jgi:hypothetical protein
LLDAYGEALASLDLKRGMTTEYEVRLAATMTLC